MNLYFPFFRATFLVFQHYFSRFPTSYLASSEAERVGKENGEHYIAHIK